MNETGLGANVGSGVAVDVGSGIGVEVGTGVLVGVGVSVAKYPEIAPQPDAKNANKVIINDNMDRRLLIALSSFHTKVVSEGILP